MKGLSKEKRILIFIGVDAVFFLIEIVTGYYAHSLALVADAFHMLNDVISLCVGLWAVRVATRRASSNEYTYGWARAELLGGLVNGVFLIALCVSIFLEAIQRFFEPQEVSNPELVFGVGAVGLLFNILGLFVFHQHSHDHGHGHDHSHDGEEAHVHSHDEIAAAENGVSNKGHSHGPSVTFEETTHDHSSPVRVRSASAASARRSRGNSRSYNTIEDMPIHPSSVRAGILAAARQEPESDDGSQATDYEDDGDESSRDEAVAVTESTSLLSKNVSSNKDSGKDDGHGSALSPPRDHKHGRHGSTGSGILSHATHKHSQPRKKASGGGGHNHADMNMRGMFLHVLGDALGNVGVMVTAVIIRQSSWKYRFYFDPLISLLITAIILKSAIPLCRETAKPLLQAVPSHVSVDDITQDIASIPGVRSCHHVHVWALTPQKLVATLDVEVGFGFGPGADATKLGGRSRWMALAREIKRCLHGHGIHSSTIQPEFCVDHSEAEHHTAALQGPRGSYADVAAQRASESSSTTAGCGDGTCLLDCKDGCQVGKECCGPVAIGPDGKGQGHASADHHGHDH